MRPIDCDIYDPSNPYKQFRSIPAFKGDFPPPYDTVQRDESDSARHTTMRDANWCCRVSVSRSIRRALRDSLLSEREVPGAEDGASERLSNIC